MNSTKPPTTNQNPHTPPPSPSAEKPATTQGWRHTCALIHMEQQLDQTNETIQHLEHEIIFAADEENRERIEAQLLRAISKKNAIETALQIALRRNPG